MEKQNTKSNGKYINECQYFAISPGTIRPGVLGHFRIYFREKQESGLYRYIKFTDYGEALSIDVLNKLQRNMDEVFIKTREKINYDKYVEENLSFILSNEDININERTDAFVQVSMKIIEQTFESSFGYGKLDTVAINRIKKLVSKTISFISDAQSIKGLSDMIGHDYETYKHSVNVFWLLMSFLGICEDILPFNKDSEGFKEYKIHCGVAALLHDIGKSKVKSAILNKNGRLSEMEFDLVKTHTVYSISILFDTELPAFVKQAILYHHEDYNGRGYPCGLKGQEIPFLARAIRIVDVFDALTSARPYKPAKKPIEALQIMVGENLKIDEDTDKRDKGMRTCFDIELMKKFIKLLSNINIC